MPIWLLLATTVPLLMLLMLLGGVSLQQVIQAVLVAAATSLAAASLGGLVALWRDRTFQSLALTVLLVVFYLCLARGLALLLELIPALADQPVLAWLDPFEALARRPRSAWRPASRPAYVFVGVMVLLSALLNAWGVLKLRVWNPSGEPIMQRERPDEEAEAKERADFAALASLGRRPARQIIAGCHARRGHARPPTKADDAEQTKRKTAHAAPGAARTVGANPILWREISTRAYGRRPLLVKTAYYIVLALICYFALAPLWGGARFPFAAAYGLAPVGVLSLLLAAAQAATAITSERDVGALDLLLVTDLTPKEFIFGKLGGILWNTKEYLIPPLILAVVYACWSLLAAPPAGHKDLAFSMNATALVCVDGGSSC